MKGIMSVAPQRVGGTEGSMTHFYSGVAVTSCFKWSACTYTLVLNSFKTVWLNSCILFSLACKPW